MTASANPFFAPIIPLHALSRRFRRVHHPRQTRFPAEAIPTFHIEVGEAVAEGDMARAGERVDAFLDHIGEFIRFVGLELACPPDLTRPT